MNLSARWSRPPRLSGWGGGWWAKSTWPADSVSAAAGVWAATAPTAGFWVSGTRPVVWRSIITLPLANLHPVPGNVPDAFAVFTEPLAAALEIPEQIHLRPDSRALIIGDGKLGLLIALVLRLSGCELHLVGRHPDKMDFVAARGVKTHPAEAFAEKDFDVVIEATGSPAGWQAALAAVRPRGIIVVKSTYPGALDFNPTELVVPEVTVVGSRCGPFRPGPAPAGPEIDQPQEAHFSRLSAGPGAGGPGLCVAAGRAQSTGGDAVLKIV